MSMGIHAFVSDPNHPLICGYCSREESNETYHGPTMKTKLKQEPVADGGGMPPGELQIIRNCIESGKEDGDIATIHVDRLGDLLAAYASSQEALRAAREIIEEYRESHVNSRRPCVDDTLGGISTSTDSRCSTCKEADSLLSPEGSSR